MLTDDRCQVMVKAHMDFRPGKLKPLKQLKIDKYFGKIIQYTLYIFDDKIIKKSTRIMNSTIK